MATWDFSNTKHHVLICNGGSCMRTGAEELTQEIRNEIKDQKLDEVIHTTRTRCNGRCEDKSVVIHYPKGTWYQNMQTEDAKAFVKSISKGKDYDEKISHTYSQADGFVRQNNVPIGEMKQTKSKGVK
jgi:(2Fe-2S) ferredoxin